MCADFTERVHALYKSGVSAILREKDLTETEYETLAESLIRVCPDIILHTHINAAKWLGSRKIHLPLRLVRGDLKPYFETVGVSVHSPDEAIAAQKGGADYVIAGHIFETDCKRGLAPRGIDFLKDTVRAVSIPVYAIGGITPEYIAHVREAGAAGACVMSGFMRCENTEKYLEKLLKKQWL